MNKELELLRKCKDGCIVNKENEPILEEYRTIGMIKYYYDDNNKIAKLTELGERYLFDKNLDNCIIHKIVSMII